MNPMMNQMMSQMMGQMTQQNPMLGMLMQSMQGTTTKKDARTKLADFVRNNPNNPSSQRLGQALAQTSGMSDADMMAFVQKFMSGK